MTITAAADGSALGNPGPSGWAWYIDDANWRAGGWDHGTNNMGELMAVLDLLNATADRPDEPLHILCDSQYVINSVTKWMPGWKRKGWKKADGKPVLNVELLKQIDAALAGRTYTFEWVKGHAGHDLNEAADVRARAAATAHQRGVAPDAGPGLVGAPPAAAGAQGTTTAPASSVPTRAAPSSATAVANGTEPDLFSSLEGVQETGTGNAVLDAVVTLERELLEPEVRADASAVSYLLHADFRQIGSHGDLHDRDTAIAVLEESAAAPAGTFELLDAVTIADTVLLTYRLSGTGYATIVASLWVQADGRWRLRFRQSTPER
ncbi:ribonuclease HI family protein [Zhihengliuella halotolerans]|uniref:Ribonuclease H n=1 Tax=Zhihengliuella halotolerans TaxID=370736 RepID=A0A4Q8ADY6_9MICC|nr:ribonuclease HI family protein [Zhihengliuella halotolerans]RZU62477.1 ribonuclease HI [Zhihengliuella halotolerans]